MKHQRRIALALRLASQIASPTLVRIRAALAHWEKQRTYHGPSWYGIEQFHLALARTTNQVAIEAAGWYKYPSSTRPDMDGKDWRLLIPDGNGVIAVNCHSLLHDGVWTLRTTVYHTHDVDPSQLQLVGHPDHWVRTLLWTHKVAEVLETSGYQYDRAKNDINRRLELTAEVKQIASQLLPKTIETYQALTGGLAELTQLHIGVSPVGLDGKGKVGIHTPPNAETPYSIITVHPKTFDKPGYLRHVVQHELIHFITNGYGKGETHGRLFHQMSEQLGLPKEMRN